MMDLASLGYRVDTSGLKKGQREVKKLGTLSKSTSKNLIGVGKSSTKASRGIASIGRESAKSSRGIANINKSLTAFKGLLMASVFTMGIAGLVGMVDGYKNVNSLLKIVTPRQAEFNSAQERLFEISQKNFASIENTTRLYAGQAKQLQSLGYSQEQQLLTVDLFNKAMVTSGSTQGEASAATLQWIQAMGSGILRGQEFNSIMENGRGVAIALADGLKVSMGTLRTMAMKGSLSAKKVVDALLTQSEAIKKRFSEIPITVGRAWTQLENSATVVLASVNKKMGDVSGSIAKFMSNISKSLDSINIDKVVFGIKTVALLLTAMFLPAMIAIAFNPLVLMIAGIVMASVKLAQYSDRMMTVGKNSATVGEWIGGTWDFIKDRGTGAWESIQSFFNDARNDMSNPSVWNSIIGYISMIPKLARTHVNHLIGVWVGAFDAIVQTFRSLPKIMGEIGKSAGSFMANALLKNVRSITKGLQSAFDFAGIDIKLPKVPELHYLPDLSPFGDISDAFEKAFNKDYIGSVGDSIRVNIIDPIGKFASDRHDLNASNRLGVPPAPVMESMTAGIDKVTKSVGKLTKAQKALEKAKKDMIKSEDLLAQGRAKTLLDLVKEKMKIGKNELALYKLNIEHLRYGKNKLKLSAAEVAHRVALKSVNIALKKQSELSKQAMEARKDALKILSDAKSELNSYLSEQKTGVAIVDNLTESEMRQLQTYKDKLSAVRSYTDILKNLKQKQMELSSTPQQIFQKNLESKGIVGNDFNELSNLNAANDAFSAYGQVDAENLRFETELERMRTAEQLKLDTIIPFREMRETAELAHQNNLIKIRAEADKLSLDAQIKSFQLQTKGAKDAMGGILSILKSAGAEQSGVYKVMFAASKAFAIAESIIKIQQGIAQASSLPFPANLPAIGAVISATAGIISTIQSTQYAGAYANGGDFTVGGMDGVDKNRITMDVSKGERVSVRTPQQQKQQTGSMVQPVINLTVVTGSDRNEVKQSRNSDGSQDITAFVAGIVEQAKSETKEEIYTEFLLGGDGRDAVKVAANS